MKFQIRTNLPCPESIAAAITGSPTTSIAVNLDTLADKMLSLGNMAWSRGGISDIGQYFIALIIYGFGAVLVVILGAQIMMSKVLLTLLLAIGPLFIIASLFQITQRFFDSWIGVLMNAAFILILAASLGSTFLTIAQNFSNNITNPTITTTIGFAMFFSMLTFVVKQIPGVAAALGGGFALSAQGAIRGMVDKIKGGGKVVNQLDKLPKNTRDSVNNVKQNYRDNNRVSTSVAKLGAHAYQKTFKRNSITGK